MEFGQRFKEEREKQGYTLEAVEEETKIRKMYIKAIENEEFELLPPKVYAIGFVKRYSKFLKLDENQMVEEFKLLAFSPEEETVIEEQQPVIRREFNWPKKLNLKNIFAAIVFLIVAVWIGNYMVGYFSSQGVKQNTNKQPISQQVQKQSPPTAKSQKATVLIEARQRCWIEVLVDDKAEFNGILLPGQTKNFTGKEKVLIKAGNAGGINITFNNKNLGLMGQPGQVIEREFNINTGTK